MQKDDTVGFKIDNLANAVGEGFKEMRNEMQDLRHLIQGVDHKVDLVRSDIAELRFDHKKMLTRIENLELKTFGSLQEN